MQRRPGLDRRRLLAGTAAVVFAPACLAQPVAPLRLLCGYPAGGSVDLVSRKLAEHLAPRTGEVVVVDNKPGAAGRLAVAELRRASPPSSAVLITPASVITLYPHVYASLGYDVFADLQPVATVAATAFALAAGPAAAGVTTLKDMQQFAAARKAPLACGNAGAGSMPHFMAIQAGRDLRVELSHVPYRGGTAAAQAAVGGELPLVFTTEAAVRPFVAAGRLRVLATTAATRDASTLAGAPTFVELGYASLAKREWFGAFLPAAAPGDRARRLADHLQAITREPDVVAAWGRIGVSPEWTGGDAMRAAIRTEHDEWAPLVRASGFTPES